MRRLAHTWISAALLLCGSAAIAEEASALLGCWRGQQTQITRADGTSYASNGNCLLVYGKAEATSRCRSDSGDAENVSRIDAMDATTLHLTLMEAPNGQPKGDPYELRYRLDGDWLLIERDFPGASGKQPRLIRSVSVRESGAAFGQQGCQLRERSALRIGRTPTSSLKFQEPKGWRAWLVDPAAHAKIAAAIGPSFLIGAFVPAGSATDVQAPASFVLVLDDTRSGPQPVTPARFPEVKQALIKELGAARIRCNEADRVCGVMRASGQGAVYMELLNLKGRVAMVMATSTVAKADALQSQVQPFVAQLRSDNP